MKKCLVRHSVLFLNHIKRIKYTSARDPKSGRCIPLSARHRLAESRKFLNCSIPPQNKCVTYVLYESDTHRLKITARVASVTIVSRTIESKESKLYM